MVSREHDDSTDMNAEELDLFQTISVAIQCPAERVRAIQWAADEELQEWNKPWFRSAKTCHDLLEIKALNGRSVGDEAGIAFNAYASAACGYQQRLAMSDHGQGRAAVIFCACMHVLR